MSQKYDSKGDKKINLVTAVLAFSAGMSNFGNTAGTSGVVGEQIVFVGAGAASLSQSVNGGSATLTISVPAQTNQTIGVYASSQTTGAASSTTVDARSLTFVGAGNISVGASAGSIIISGVGGGGGGALSAGMSTQGNTAGDTGLASQRLVFAGIGDVTLSGSTNGGSMTISISSPVQTNQTIGLFASSNTTGQSSSTTRDARSITFRGAGVASVGYSAGEIIISVPPGGGGDGYNILAAGTQTATSAGTVLFADSNGINFGMSGSTRITASYTVPSQLSAFAQGNTTQSSSGTIPFNSVQFQGAGIISIGVSNGSVVVSATTVAQSNQLITFFAQGNTTQSSSGTRNASSIDIRGAGDISVGVTAGSIVISGSQSAQPQISAGLSNVGNTAGDTGLVTGRLVLVGGNNITASGSTNGGSMTISFSGPNTQSWFSQAGVSNIGNTVGDTGMQNSRLVLAGGNNITLSQATAAGGLGTISFSGPARFSGGMSTQGNTLGDTGFAVDRLVIVGTNNITLSGSTNGGSMTISISGGAGAAGNTGFISAGGATASLGTVVFSDSNGMSFGVNGQTVTGSFARMVVGLTNAGNTAGDTGTVSRQVVFIGGNNITLSGSTNGSSMSITISAPNTVAQTNQTLGLYALGNTTGQSSSSTYDARTISINGGGIISVGNSNGSLLISASQSVQPQISAGLSNIGNTAGDTGLVTGRLVFAGGNNVTLSGSTNGGSMTISVSGPATQSWFSQAGISNLGNTAGDTGMQASRLVFAGVGNVTLSGATAAGGLGTISISIPAGATATGNLGAIAAGTQTATSGTVVFSDSNGIAFGMSGSTRITASYTVPSQLSVFAQSNTTQSSSGVIPFNSLQFQGAGIASVGVSNGSVVISVPAGGGGGDGVVSIGISTDGNTAGTTGTVSSGRYILAGVGPITLSQSLNGQSGTLSISAPAVSSLVGAGVVSLSTNGSTITISVGSLGFVAQGNTVSSSSGTVNPAAISISAGGFASAGVSNGSILISVLDPQVSNLWLVPPVGSTTREQVGNGTIAVLPMIREDAFSVSAAVMYASITASSSSNSSHAGNISVYIGIYTRNVSTLSLASSGSAVHQWSNTSNNSLGSITGLRELSVPININYQSGDIWVAVMSRTNTTNANWFTASNQLIKVGLDDGQVIGAIGQASNGTRGILGFGRFSASSSVLPNSMAFSQISGQGITNTLSKFFPQAQFYNFTA